MDLEWENDLLSASTFLGLVVVVSDSVAPLRELHDAAALDMGVVLLGKVGIVAELAGEDGEFGVALGCDGEECTGASAGDGGRDDEDFGGGDTYSREVS